MRYSAWSQAWEKAGLLDYSDFSDSVEYCNQEPDWCDTLRGEWYYGDDEALVIYCGTFGNDHSSGSSLFTHAEVYDTLSEYRKALSEWEERPEYLEENQ